MSDDETLDITLRSPGRVAARCIIVAALLTRATIEEVTGEKDAELAAEAFDLRGWLHTEGLWDDVTPKEKAFLSAPVGHISPDDIVAASWEAAALDALAWALGLVPALDPTELGDTGRLVDEIPHPWQKTEPWIAARELRPEPEIVRQREIAEIWDWRVSVEPSRRSAEGRELKTIERAITETTRESQAAGLLPPGKKGSFRFSGSIPVTDADLEDLDRLVAITTERLLALNWLCGFGDSWDDVPLDL